MAKRKAVTKGPDGGPQADAAEITIGDYPNSKNIRAWWGKYFGVSEINVDLKFTYLHARDLLPSLTDAESALRFGIEQGYKLTDAGESKAYQIGLLSDDSPAVIKGKSIHRRGSKRINTLHDRDIYRLHKYGGESYQEIAIRFDMDKGEVQKIFWKMDKRQSRTK